MQIKFENVSLFVNDKIKNECFYFADVSNINSFVSLNNCFIFPGFVDVYIRKL